MHRIDLQFNDVIQIWMKIYKLASKYKSNIANFKYRCVLLLRLSITCELWTSKPNDLRVLPASIRNRQNAWIKIHQSQLLTEPNFGMIQIRINDPRSLESWCIKETEESPLGKDSSDPLMQHDPSHRWILDHWSWCGSSYRNTPLVFSSAAVINGSGKRNGKVG